MPSLRDRLFRRSQLREEARRARQEAIRAQAAELAAVCRVDELEPVLRKHCADGALYRIESSGSGVYAIRREGGGWTVGWDGAFRGDDNHRRYDTERDACQRFLELVLMHSPASSGRHEDLEALREAWLG